MGAENKNMPEMYTSITPQKIINIVCEILELDVRKFYSTSRKRELVYGRHIATRLIHEEVAPKMSLLNIGRALNPFNPFDHTTIIHNLKTCKNDCETNIKYNETFILCRKRVFESKTTKIAFTSMGYSPLYNKTQP